MVRELLGAAGARLNPATVLLCVDFPEAGSRRKPPADAPHLRFHLHLPPGPSDRAFVSSEDAGRLVENVDNSIHSPFSNVDICA